MRNGSCKRNVTHALAANLRLCDFNSAFFANLALVTDALILSAMAFPVLERSEDPFAEKAVNLGLEGAVIYGFGLGDLAVRPFENLFGRCKTDFD